MNTMVFHVEADKVDTNLLTSIKAFFGNSRVKISIESEKSLADLVQKNRSSKTRYVFEGDAFDEVSKKLLNDEVVDFEVFKREIQ